MEEVLALIKSTIRSHPIEGSVNWLFIKSHDENLSEYQDYDLFVIIKDEMNIVSVVKETSRIAIKLTIILKKYVSIYPIYEKDFIDMKSQFLKNLNKKGVSL